MASPNTLAEEAHTLLQNLFGTGQHSDLIIRAPKEDFGKVLKDFNVHKAIVFSALPVLQQIAVKNRDFTIVKLAESANVVEAMLRYMYKLPLTFTPGESDTQEELRRKASLETFLTALHLRRAADENQFNMPSLIEPTELAMGNCLFQVIFRTFEPVKATTLKAILEAEAELPREERVARRAARQEERERQAHERPMVEFVSMIMALEEKQRPEDSHLRLAALFLLAVRLPKVMNSRDALGLLRKDKAFYVMATNLAFAWLKLAKKGEPEEQRKLATRSLLEMCADRVGVAREQIDVEGQMVFRAACWDDEQNPWLLASLEGDAI